MRHSALSRYHWLSGRMSAEFNVRRFAERAAVKKRDDPSRKLLEEMLRQIRNMPPRIVPGATALELFSERLGLIERRAFVLGAASRIAIYVDAAIESVPELSCGQSGAFALTVDSAFTELWDSRQLGHIELLNRYDALLKSGILSPVYGGQGNSLVEELLDPAMLILRSFSAEDGLNVSYKDEDSRTLITPGYKFANDVCRIANHMLDPRKFPDTDDGGIPPWALESLELDAQWYTLELLSQRDSEASVSVRKVAHYSAKCRTQNTRLTASGMPDFRMRLMRPSKTSN